MAMKINTNIDAMGTHNSLVKAQSSVSKSLQRLSSGFRINAAKDDAAGFAVANAFKAKISSLRVAKQNATEANSMLQIADGAYTKVHDILIRMKDLATQAASGQTENRAKLQIEFASLQSEIDRIATSTTYSTMAGSTVDTAAAGSLQLINSTGNMLQTQGITFQIGDTNTLSVAGNSNTLNLKLDAACAQALGVDAGSTHNVSISSAASAQAAMTAIDTALGSINASMASVGAMQNRLDFTVDNLDNQILNFSASESAIRDVDMAAEIMSFTKNQIIQQAGMAMLAQANQAPQQVLQLLGG
jgi:flagellin